MTGEPREEMHVPQPDRLPPVVASSALAAPADSALAGPILPPYRPGMYAGGASPSAISELSAALSAEQDVGPPVAEGYPAAWREDVVATAGLADWSEETEVAEPSEPPEMLLLDEAEIAPVEDERVPTGFEQAIAELETAESLTDALSPEAEPEPPAAGVSPWEAEPEPTSEAVADWDAWDADETAVYDLRPAAGEDTGAWQDSWATPPAETDEAAAGEPAAAEEEPFLPVSELHAEEPGTVEPPEAAGDVQEWLEAGAVEIDALTVGEEAAAEPAYEPPPPSFETPLAEPAEEELGPVIEAEAQPLSPFETEDWVEVEPGEEAGEIIEMVEEDAGPTLEFAPVTQDAGEAPADEAWAPFEPREPAAEEPAAEMEETPSAAVDAGLEEHADERVAIVPPTPLDSWFGDQGAEGEATWEAFGRALEEAASWGDLGATIATGLPPGEARQGTGTEAEAADQAAGEQTGAAAAELPPAVEAETPAAAPADPAVTDLARRLELLAQRLRSEGEKGVEHALSEGDRLEASLAGFIAGYVAARRG